jgi:alpha-1,2-rhamnosyltransferase
VDEIVDVRLRAGLLVRRPQISHFLLGSELDLIRGDDQVAVEVQAIFKRTDHIFLVVGSIEPRKNHDFILNAFERFWASGGRGTLLIIGKVGWNTEAFLRRAAMHPKLGSELHLLRNASDADLDYCYRNATALVFASMIEGFGLPVVEAFQRGLPVLCSDIPVFREIADDKARFFNLSSPGSLTTALEDFSEAQPMGKRTERSPQPWLSWDESTRQLFREIVKVCDQEGHRDTRTEVKRPN